MKILILMGNFGTGHLSPAQALVEDLAGGEIVDLFQYLNPRLAQLGYRTFNWVAREAPPIYRGFSRIQTKRTRPQLGVWEGKIKKLLEEKNPDLLISTHPLSSRLLAGYKEKNQLDLPLITCITDLGGGDQWIHEGTDFYLLPCQDLEEELLAQGLKPSCLLNLGLPVRQAFKSLEEKRPTSPRQVLIMGGGLGILPDLDDFLGPLIQREDLRIRLITGSNQKLYRRLRASYPGLEVLGFVEHMEEELAQADLLISKPGANSLFEAIYSQTPILVIDPWLPQEIENAKFIVDQGLGRVLGPGADIAYEINHLLDQEEELEGMRKNMGRIKEDLLKKDLGEVLLTILEGARTC